MQSQSHSQTRSQIIGFSGIFAAPFPNETGVKKFTQSRSQTRKPEPSPKYPFPIPNPCGALRNTNTSVSFAILVVARNISTQKSSSVQFYIHQIRNTTTTEKQSCINNNKFLSPFFVVRSPFIWIFVPILFLWLQFQWKYVQLYKPNRRSLRLLIIYSNFISRNKHLKNKWAVITVFSEPFCFYWTSCFRYFCNRKLVQNMI